MTKQLSGFHAIEIENIDATTIPHIDSIYANAISSGTPPPNANNGSLHLSDQLITSLTVADVVIIASPMHNYTVPSSLKSWVDHVVRAAKTFEITADGKHGLLDDKPVYILVSAGGMFTGENASQPDFFTPYMKEVLTTVGLESVFFFTIEGTASNKDAVRQRIESVQSQVSEHLARTQQ